MSMARDPVCGMGVDEQTAAYKVIRENKVYYFCSSMCQTEFNKNPNKYVQQAAVESRHATHYGGYCGVSGCGKPARGLAWYMYIALIFFLLLLFLLVR